MYANHKKWDLRELFCQVQHDKTHLEDCENCKNPNAKIDVFKLKLQFIGDLDESQKARLLEIADKCPVHRTLEGDVQIETTMMVGNS